MGHASITEEGTGEYIVLHRRTVKRMAAEQRELVDRLAITEAELVVVRKELEDLRQRARAAQALWKEVPPASPPPTAEGS